MPAELSDGYTLGAQASRLTHAVNSQPRSSESFLSYSGMVCHPVLA